MAERLKRAAAWLGLVTDDRYAEYDDAESQELTEGLSREEMLGSELGAARRRERPRGPEKAASVTPLETAPLGCVHCANVHPARLSPTDG